MTIEEFILHRVAEQGGTYYRKREDYEFFKAWEKSMIQIVEWHSQWPVLVESPTKFEPNLFDDFEAGANSYMIRASKQIAFVTQQEYRKVFGSEPPTAPILRIIAAIWKDHPDYDEEWAL